MQNDRNAQLEHGCCRDEAMNGVNQNLAMVGGLELAPFPSVGRSRIGTSLALTPRVQDSVEPTSGRPYRLSGIETGVILDQAAADMRDLASPERHLLSELRGALDRDEFDLAFQPKIDLRTRDYVGAEVLVRWRNRVIGDVSPSRFIPAAERSGLISGIGAWVVGKVIERVAGLPAPVRRQSLAINVSAAQLQDARFVPWLMALLDEAEVCGTSLEIELTESALTLNTRTAGRRLAELRQRGITITLDDFGTGYSALSHLRHFPVDVIKIAPEFVSDMITDSASGRLVGAVIAMAKSLDLRVVAEGIENDAQADRLSDLGCDVGQGYLFARPMNFEAFVQWGKSFATEAGRQTSRS